MAKKTQTVGFLIVFVILFSGIALADDENEEFVMFTIHAEAAIDRSLKSPGSCSTQKPLSALEEPMPSEAAYLQYVNEKLEKSKYSAMKQVSQESFKNYAQTMISIFHLTNKIYFSLKDDPKVTAAIKSQVKGVLISCVEMAKALIQRTESSVVDLNDKSIENAAVKSLKKYGDLARVLHSDSLKGRMSKEPLSTYLEGLNGIYAGIVSSLTGTYLSHLKNSQTLLKKSADETAILAKAQVSLELLREQWQAKSKQETLKKIFKDQPGFSEYILAGLNDQKNGYLDRKLQTETEQEQRVKKLNEAKVQIDDPKKRQAFIKSERAALTGSADELVSLKKDMDDLASMQKVLEEIMHIESSSLPEVTVRKDSDSSSTHSTSSLPSQ